MPESSGHDADKRDDPESSASASEEIATAVEELLGIVVRFVRTVVVFSFTPTRADVDRTGDARQLVRSCFGSRAALNVFPSLAPECVSSITRAAFSGERDTRTRSGHGLPR